MNKRGIILRDSYGSWKTWKDLEFYCGIFQDWKVQENGYWSWKVLQICWTQVKNMNVFQTAGRISNEILGVKGLMWIIKSWKNQSESWRSPGIFFLKKGTNPDFRDPRRPLHNVVMLLILLLLYIFRLKWILLHSIATIRCLLVQFYDNSVRMQTLLLDCHVVTWSPGTLSINSQMETSKLFMTCDMSDHYYLFMACNPN